ncbi:hypothetical protein PV327_005718 [Microctonus hyperodae]|uniref:Uncharacterized protein n=1 Tax=Microctonus hyperodae TaxID=165561 RepID=A0AA39G2S6_MICHY|nr:hypothetical protein PV327_005718 [Microctonus hyperodae]
MALCLSNNSELENICRICLKQDKIMSPIFDVINNKTNCNSLAQCITSIAHVEIDESDCLPKTICWTCKKFIEQFYEFRAQVEISDKAIRSYLKLSQSIVQNVCNEDQLEINNSMKDTTHTLVISNNENVQAQDVSNVNQSPDEMIEILNNDYIENQENIENIEEIMTAETDINCQLCLISFESLNDLKNHVNEHCLITERQIFKDKPIYNSITVGENTKNNQLTNAPQQQCIDQQQTIETDKINIDHKIIEGTNGLKTFMNGMKLKCKHCYKSFSKLALVTHNEKCRFREKKIVCDACGKQFKNRSGLRYHKSTHTATLLICEYCSKQFHNTQSFSIHLKRHTHGTRYHCEKCGKSYYTNSELTRHVQSHLEVRKHPCHLCEMSFMSRPELNRHLKYHNGVKPFECDICSKTYYESGHLKVHQRVHTGERPFVCQFCNKGFVTRSKLLRHTKIHEK